MIAANHSACRKIVTPHPRPFSRGRREKGEGQRLLHEIPACAGMSGIKACIKSPHGLILSLSKEAKSNHAGGKPPATTNPKANQISSSATHASRLISIQNPLGGKTA